VKREFVIDAPHESSVILVTPRPPETDQNKPAAPPKGKRKK